MRWIVCGAVALALALPGDRPAAAQQASPPASPPTEGQEAPFTITVNVPGLKRRAQQIPLLRSEVRLVTLDVAVTDSKGRTVKGLRPEDFTVREEGASQTIASFEEHVQPNADEAAAMLDRARLPRNTFSDARPIEESSAIVLVLDALDSPSVQDQMYLRQQMIEYMKRVPAGTRIAIVQLDTELRMVQNFSSDPVDLLAAVKSKRDQPRVSPLVATYITPGPLGVGAAGAIDDASNMNAPTISTTMNTERRTAILNQAVPELMRYMGGIPGRKSVVWFYSQSAPTGAYSVSMQTMFDTDQTTFLDAMSKTTDELRMSHIALYMVNVAGPGRLLAENYAMEAMVQKQGGEMIFANNNLAEVIEHVADKAWNYYTLSYTPQNSDFDGHFRKVIVDVARPGLQLQYRPGYYAKSDDVQRTQHFLTLEQKRGVAGASRLETTIENAMLMGAPAPHDVLFTAQVEPSAGTDKLKGGAPAAGNFLDVKYRKAKYREYRLHFSVDPHTISFRNGRGGTYVGMLDVVAVVYDDRGLMVNSLRSNTTVRTDPGSLPSLQQTGIEVGQTIAIPAKGNFFVRLGVLDNTSGKAGALEVPVDAIALVGARK